MAIGDCFSIIMGTAATNRQPASGVFEQVGAILKYQQNDVIGAYNGSVHVSLLIGGADSAALIAGSGATRALSFNMAWLIGNTVYMRKAGTSDTVNASGVQVDA